MRLSDEQEDAQTSATNLKGNAAFLNCELAAVFLTPSLAQSLGICEESLALGLLSS